MPDVTELSIAVKCDGIKGATQQMIDFVHACECAAIAVSELTKVMEVYQTKIKAQSMTKASEYEAQCSYAAESTFGTSPSAKRSIHPLHRRCTDFVD